MITKKLSKTIGIMNRLKNRVPLYTLLHIYNSLILSCLTHGVLLWGWKCQCVIGLQKEAVRIPTNTIVTQMDFFSL